MARTKNAGNKKVDASTVSGRKFYKDMHTKSARKVPGKKLKVKKPYRYKPGSKLMPNA